MSREQRETLDAILRQSASAFPGVSDVNEQRRHEVLLDDAIRLARQAAIADVEVTLDITPGVIHVFQAYYPMLDEGGAALDRAGQLLLSHLASAERVTA